MMIDKSMVLVVVAWAMVGCSSLPEVGPFADATIELNSAIDLGGKTVVAELRTMEATSQADTLEEAWKARTAAGGALVTYAESLRAIVSAGHSGKESASKVIDSVTSLAATAGISIPASSAAFSTATDIGKFLYGQISLMRAANSLEAALEAAQPAVSRIAVFLDKDLRAAGEIFQLANTDIQQSLELKHRAPIDRLRYRDELLKERDNLYEESPPNEARLLQIAELIAATDEWYDPYQEQLAESSARLRRGEALFSAALDATGRWVAAHDLLVQAVKERRPYNDQSLVQAAVEIRELVGRMREL